jgi:hypothetical protein
LVKNGTQTDSGLTTGIRIDVEQALDDLLEDWAGKDGRSKREHVRHIVREIAGAYSKDPLILHRIALVSAGAAKFIPA